MFRYSIFSCCSVFLNIYTLMMVLNLPPESYGNGCNKSVLRNCLSSQKVPKKMVTLNLSKVVLEITLINQEIFYT